MMEVCQEEAKTEKTKKVSLRYCVEQFKFCGSRIVRLNRARHNKTKKHLDANYLWLDMYETN